MKIRYYYIACLWLMLFVPACSEAPTEDVHAEHHHSDEEEAHEGEEGEEEEDHDFIAELTEAQEAQAGISFESIAMREIGSGIRVTGKLEAPPQSLVTVSVPIGGFLKSTELLPGSKVKKGELIAIMEHPDYIALQQEYWETHSALVYAESDYKRQQALAKDQVNAQKAVDQAKASYTRLQATLNGLKARLQLLNIYPEKLQEGIILMSIPLYAPINGYVAKVETNIGAYVRPMDVIFKLIDPHHLHVELELYEKDIASVKIGQKIRFTLANEAKEREAEVFLIGKEVGEDRSISIHGHLLSHEDDDHLMPGMFLQATIETGAKQKASVPETAVMRYEGQSYIFAKMDKAHHFEMTPVTEYESEGGYIAVGFPADFDKTRPIVNEGAFVLLSKLKNSEGGHHHH